MFDLGLTFENPFQGAWLLQTRPIQAIAGMRRQLLSKETAARRRPTMRNARDLFCRY
jgi:hypothetical protein